MIINHTELAWAAGFFDGEGCTYFGHRQRMGRKGQTLKYYNISLSLVQAGDFPLELLRRFDQATGSLGVIKPKPRYRNTPGHWKPQQTYAIYGLPKVQAVIALLWKYLGPAKRAQALMALGKVKQYHAEREPSVASEPGRRMVTFATNA